MRKPLRFYPLPKAQSYQEARLSPPNPNWFAAIKPLYLFATMLALGLLMSFQGSALTIDLATNIISAPVTGSTALGGSTVTFSARTVSPGGGTFNNVQQQLVIGNISSALNALLTFTSAGTRSYNAGTSEITILFPIADLTSGANRTEAASFTVPGNVPLTVISVRASYIESGNDTDNNQGNNDGSATNAQSSITLRAAAPTITSVSPVSGPTAGGTIITVNGTNFVGGGTTATIAGAAATVTYVSSTQIKFTSPVHAAGAVPIVVTTNGGTDSDTYTYLAAPTITSLAPASGPITAGTVVTVTGTNFASAALGGTTATLAGTAVTVTYVSPTQIQFTAPAHAAGAVPFVVTTNGGTDNGTYTYLAAPTITTFTPPSGPYTGGTTVTVNGTNFVNGNTTATIAGTAVTVTFVSTSQITIVTPARTIGVSGTITVTTNGGTATSSTNYTYTGAGSITGNIFEDPNYGGGAGRPLAGTTGAATVSSAATVELYTGAGAFVATTTTNVAGQYSFPNLSAGSYIVRVVNSTVRSTRPGSVAGLVPVQTFRTNVGANDLNRVGGEAPELQDAGAYLAGVTPVTLSFTGLNTTGDQTVFIDNITLSNGGAFPNNSFEAPSQNGGFTYTPNGASWIFAGQSGIAANGSGFGPATTTAGTQVAFVQNTGSLQQTANLTSNTTYTLTLLASQRTAGGGQRIQGSVVINGVTTNLTFSGGPVNGGNLAPTSSTAYSTYTATFTVPSAGTNALASLTQGTSTAQSQSPATLAADNSTVSGVDFGYNYSTIVNDNDSGQGSLRQFIINANALTNAGLAQAGQLAGREVSVFMVPDGNAHNGQRSGLASNVTGSAGAARVLIQLSTALPALTDARTRISGATQTANINDSNTGVLGTGGTVGVKGVALAQINRPEVEIQANTSLAYGLDLEGDSLGVSGIAIHGAAIQAGATAPAINLQILSNLIGTTALAVSDPGGTIYNAQFGIYIRNGGSYGTVRNNLIGYAGNSGLSSSSGSTAAGKLVVTGNEFVQNGYRVVGGDAISVGDQANSGPMVITHNLITTSNSDGLQFEIGQNAVGGVAYNVVRNNTFFDNGNGSTSLARAQLEGAAILYLQRNGSRTGTNADSIAFNRIYQSQASGIVVGYGQRNVIISRNSTFGNGTIKNSNTGGNLGIDLISQPGYYVSGPGLGATDYGNGDGVTANDGTLNTAFGNGGIDYPVFTLTRYNNANSITVTGYVGTTATKALFANATIELYIANNLDVAPRTNNGPIFVGDGLDFPHGEGQTYIGTLTANASGDFTGNITAPTGITFTTSGQSLTATAFLATTGTSEFAPNSPLAATIVSGYVFEDANYGGGSGRSRATLGAGAVGRPGATVEIYDNTNAIVGTTTTDVNGQYSFNVASGNYTVRTLVPTVTSARTNGTTATPAPVAVQTYVRGDVNRVGGEDPSATTDSPAAATVGATVSFVGLNPSGLDNTAFVDNVEILQSGVAVTTNPIGNPGFETPSLGATFGYAPSGSSWSYAGAGIAGNGSAFSPNTSTGTQVGFLQGAGASMSQTIPLAAGVYSVRFRTAQRTDSRLNNLTISIRLGGVNGVEIGQITPSSSTYTSFTTSEFSVSGTAAASVPGVSQVPLIVSNTSVTDVDFGYNFDVITNTNETGQGSLRQFLANSNALGGESTLAQVYTNGSGVTTALTANKESSVFMVPGAAAVPGLRSGLTNRLNGSGVAVFTPNTATNGALIITDANTVIDGTTQTNNSNTNSATLGTGGTVGSDTGTALGTLNGPEVQIVGVSGTANSTYGLTLSGAGDGVKGIAILGFGNSSASNTLNANGANIYVTGSATSGVAITGNVIGTVATTFPTNGTDPNANAARSTGNGILLASLAAGTVSGTISNNLIGYNANSGIQDFASASTSSLMISGNEIRNNGMLSSTADGLFLGMAGGTVQANLITGNKGSGVDLNGSAGSISVTSNTVSSNGTTGGTETSGIRAYGVGNTISLNSITNNVGTGVLVLPGTNTANVAGSTIITQNGITTNGRLGIDLLNAGDSETTGTAQTLNDTGDVDGRTNGSTAVGANGLLNFPVIAQVRVSGTNLLVRGYARPGANVELFAVGTADPTGFGEGATYLASAVEGSVDDSNNQVASYSGTINGINQGTDNTNIFVFSIPFSKLPTGFVVTAGTTVVSATATLAGIGTSEFSGVVTVTTGPLPVELVSFTATAVKNVDAALGWRTASEKNNDHFDVERSLTGTDFVKIGQVAGQGTASAPTDYSLTDTGIGAKAGSTVYYRLKQVDVDGTATYSPVRTVAFTKLVPAIALFPNPATAATQLDLMQLPTGTYQVSVLDALGRVVLGRTLEAGLVHDLNLTTIASGIYNVLVRGQSNGQVISLTKRLIKE
ncbi:IPT/TIG domain-containing protein [Hymenobacter terricola]|uniref:IPT/TIG domain-containing protein n=1 Tax=Hymenobacter terricola TaxID=2819236 RepID=UPI001B303235|nr:IPT/TIG domain-containing protein [Hymenobacter terricola]